MIILTELEGDLRALSAFGEIDREAAIVHLDRWILLLGSELVSRVVVNDDSLKLGDRTAANDNGSEANSLDRDVA